MTDFGVVNPGRAKLFIQPLGFGGSWQIADAETDVDAPGGGDVTFTTEWSLGEYMRRRKAGNPSDRSFNISSRSRYGRTALRVLADRSSRLGQMFNVIIPYELASIGGTYDLTAFKLARLFIDCSAPMPGADKPILADTTGDQTSPMETYAITAGVELELRQLAHNQSSVTTVNAAINHGVSLSKFNVEYVAVGDAVAPATTPRLYYYKLEDNGTITFKTLVLNTITNAQAVRVAVQGDRVFIACTGTTASIWVASLAAIKAATNGANLSATIVTGITSGTVVNDVKVIGKYIFACGASGVIWISRDQGYSFSVLGTVTGTPTVNVIGGVTDKDVWFGCASGTIANWYLEASLTTYTPSVITGDSVTAIDVPQREGTDDAVKRWVYIGTNTGEVWSSSDAGSTAATWTRRYFPGDGSGTVSYLSFIGTRGAVLGIIHTSVAPASRVLVDYSGGFGSAWVREVSAASAFSNTGYNALVWNDQNFALVFGEVISSLGFVGEVLG